MARDKRNRAVTYTSERAVSYCLYGAYCRSVIIVNPGTVSRVKVSRIINAIVKQETGLDQLSWDEWNDAKGRTQQDIIALLTEAKKLIRKETL